MTIHQRVEFDGVSIDIPWTTNDRDLLFTQAGLADYIANDKSGLVELANRFVQLVQLITPTLEDLPVGSTIIDIGSGNSLIDIITNAKFPEKKFKFILVDEDNTFGVEHHTRIGNIDVPFYQAEYKTYNEWSFFRKTIELNSMDISSFETRTPNDVWSTDPVDFVFSIASWCWHYPVDTYLNKVHAVLKDGGIIHINSVLNTDDARLKLTSLFNPVYVKTHKYSVRSVSEHIRAGKLIYQNKINPLEFSFVFTGKK